MAIDVMSMINAELTRAATPRASKAPLFLYLTNQQALARPLLNLSGCVTLGVHEEYNEDPKKKIDAVCAKEVGKPCAYCEAAENNKKLKAKVTFFLPVWVYSVDNLDERGQAVGAATYKNEKQESVPVSGLRVLRLTSYGAVGQFLVDLNNHMLRSEDHDITSHDRLFISTGKGVGVKKCSTFPKQPKLFAVKVSGVTAERVQQRVLEALPPCVLITALEEAEAHFNATGQNMVMPVQEEVPAF